MTKTNFQKYSDLKNEVINFRNKFYYYHQDVKLDETILNDCENLVENLMSIKKHELKTIKKVMKRFFYLIDIRKCVNYGMGGAYEFSLSDRYDNESYLSIWDQYNSYESYSSRYDQYNCFDTLHSFKDHNKLFFERFTFCNYIIEYFNGTSIYINDIIDPEKITLKDYSYTLSKKLFLGIIHDIFYYFYSIDLISDYHMEKIYYNCTKIYKKINIVRDTLENTNKCITNIGIII